MPGWASLMSDEQIRSLVPVVKSFDITAAWPPEEADEEAFDEDGRYLKEDFIQVTDSEPQDGQIAYSEESITKGKVAFDKACKECHGAEGRGNIVSGKKLEDDWGFRIWPRDMTKPWTWRATQAAAGEATRTRSAWRTAGTSPTMSTACGRRRCSPAMAQWSRHRRWKASCPPPWTRSNGAWHRP